jgi:inorganic pyrophosphatase
MIDSGEFDYKVIAVADDKYYEHVSDIKDISEKEKEDIYYFMNHYKDLHNKTVNLEGWDDRENAIKVLKDCQEYYPVKFKK